MNATPVWSLSECNSSGILHSTFCILHSMIDKAPARVAGMFDAIAARYDLLNHLLSAGMDRGWRVRAIRELRLTGRESVLDVCTGTADVALAAVTRPGGAARVLGVDFSAEMLRLGAAKVARSQAGPPLRPSSDAQGVASGVEARGGRATARSESGPHPSPVVWLARGDATRLPAASGSMDAATVAFGIRNVEQPERALAEMYRVLRADGRIAILEFSIPRSALVRAVYLPYFRHVLPRIGRLVSGHGTAYTYLPASVGAFVPPERMTAMLEGCGFRQVRAIPLTLGVVTLYTGAKVSATAISVAAAS
jgi:demethylmenaquinone methyltransferase/2-methoxy-6-polyprenyl-1,4-benzoquinol methylase